MGRAEERRAGACGRRDLGLRADDPKRKDVTTLCFHTRDTERDTDRDTERKDIYDGDEHCPYIKWVSKEVVLFYPPVPFLQQTNDKKKQTNKLNASKMQQTPSLS